MEAEANVFIDMVSEVIERLEPEQRVDLDARMLAQVVHICAEYAARQLDVGAAAPIMPRIPLRQFVDVQLLLPGDRVWGREFWFQTIEATECNVVGPHVIYESGFDEQLAEGEYRRVAMSRADADEWNAMRSCFDDLTLELLAQVYGTE